MQGGITHTTRTPGPASVLLHGGTVVPASKHRHYPHNTRIWGRGCYTPNTHTLRHHFEINTSVLTQLGRKCSDPYPANGACSLPRASLRVLRRKRAVPAVQRPTRGAHAMSPARHKARTTPRQLAPPAQSEIDHIYTLHGSLHSMVQLRHPSPRITVGVPPSLSAGHHGMMQLRAERRATFSPHPQYSEPPGASNA